MSDDRRIQQFKQMSEADPENELGHFSLGKAYLDAGRHADAIAPLQRALELKPRLSKAYQLLAEAFDAIGQSAKAIDTLSRGVAVADEQGDRMPRDAMAAGLRSKGAAVPVFRSTDRPSGGEQASASSPGFTCTRCGRPSGQLTRQPFKGALGERVFRNICSTCWREWVSMGTKVINELGLVLSSKAGQDAYDQYMIEFLQLEEHP